MQPTHVCKANIGSRDRRELLCESAAQSSTPPENARSIRWKRDDTSILSTLFALMRSGIVFCLREY